MSSPDPPHSTAYTGFFQAPPAIRNPFTEDLVLQRILTRHLGLSLLDALRASFTNLGKEAVSRQIREYSDDAHRNLPYVVHWDGWGARKDKLYTTEGWQKLKGFWARSGIMEDFFSRKYGPQSRIVGFTKYVLLTFVLITGTI